MLLFCETKGKQGSTTLVAPVTKSMFSTSLFYTHKCWSKAIERPKDTNEVKK